MGCCGVAGGISRKDVAGARSLPLLGVRRRREGRVVQERGRGGGGGRVGRREERCRRKVGPARREVEEGRREWGERRRVVIHNMGQFSCNFTFGSACLAPNLD